MAIVALYIRLLPTRHRSATPRSVFVALALLLVTGLDILPVLSKYVLHLIKGPVILYHSVEWWNEQITAWFTAVLWVPHHVAGLITTLTAFLIFSYVRSVRRPGRQALILIVCALAVFSAVGLSIWITMTFAAFWIAWIMMSFLNGWHDEARWGTFVGAVALGLSLPYLIDLHRANYTQITPVIVSVRKLFPIHNLVESYHWGWVSTLAVDLLSIPLNYFMEFGFFALAGIFYWTRRVQILGRLCRNETACVTLAITSAAIATFLRSNIENNDLGWRSAMFLQFVLLLWAADVMTELVGQLKCERVRFQMSRRKAILLLVSLVIGISAVLYDAVLMKLYPMSGDLQLPIVRPHGDVLTERNLGRRYYDFRLAYQWINGQFAESAVVQHNPDIFIDLPSGLYGNRQVVAADHLYGTVFGIPQAMYRPVYSAVSALFASRTIDMEDVSAVCRRFNITALVVKDTDPIWSDPDSWVFRKFPIFRNRSTRVFDCHSFL
jgi:hypothetical protein